MYLSEPGMWQTVTLNWVKFAAENCARWWCYCCWWQWWWTPQGVYVAACWLCQGRCSANLLLGRLSSLSAQYLQALERGSSAFLSRGSCSRLRLPGRPTTPLQRSRIPRTRQRTFLQVSTRYCTAAVDKRVSSTSLYHCRQCCVVLKPRSDRVHYTVVCFMMHDCSCKLWKQYQCELSVI